MKLTPGVNFINILRAAFLYERVLLIFSVPTVSVVFMFCQSARVLGKKDTDVAISFTKKLPLTLKLPVHITRNSLNFVDALITLTIRN